jgi:hypothetical protein
MTTAGMAATRPIAVASKASAMPGATTARFVVCDFEIPMKAFMMRHTPAGARLNPRQLDREPLFNPVGRQTLGESRLVYGFLDEISDRAVSGPAGLDLTRGFRELLACRSLPIATRARRLARTSSKPFASQTVHVAIEAKARPTITAFTMMPALRNIDQGDRSLGSESIV